MVERAKVACYRFEGAPCCCILPPRKPFNTESGSVNEACKKKRTVYCNGLDCSLIAKHLSVRLIIVQAQWALVGP